MEFPGIDIEALHIPGGKGRDKTLMSVIYRHAQQDGPGKQKGGALDKVKYEDPKYLFKESIRCLHCKETGPLGGEVGIKTANLPGITCYRSTSRRGVSLNVKVKCARCQTSKNSYIKKNSLPDHILEKLGVSCDE